MITSRGAQVECMCCHLVAERSTRLSSVAPIGGGGETFNSRTPNVS